MKFLFWIALKLRLPQKFWADLYFWHQRRMLKKMLGKLDLDTSNIRFTRKNTL